MPIQTHLWPFWSGLAAFVVIVVVVVIVVNVAGRLLCVTQGHSFGPEFAFGEHDRQLILRQLPRNRQPLSRSRRIREFLCLLLLLKPAPFLLNFLPFLLLASLRFDCIGLLLLIQLTFDGGYRVRTKIVECAINALVSRLRTGEAIELSLQMVSALLIV
jgi:hypothetical protein